VAQTTGLDDAQLQQVADAFVQYFQTPPGRLDVTVRLNGQSRSLFNEREILHMEDVQGLVQWFLTMQVVGGVVILLRVAFALAVERSVRDLGRDAMIGAGLLVSLVVLVGVLSAIDFDSLWIRFHQIAFRNDMWMLDPRTDYLIMLFPEPFWFAGTIRLALAVAGGTLVSVVAGFLAWRFWRCRRRPRPSVRPPPRSRPSSTSSSGRSVWPRWPLSAGCCSPVRRPCSGRRPWPWS
jgi:integral membrane protein (TIGR01906 family)